MFLCNKNAVITHICREHNCTRITFSINIGMSLLGYKVALKMLLKDQKINVLSVFCWTNHKRLFLSPYLQDLCLLNNHKKQSLKRHHFLHFSLTKRIFPSLVHILYSRSSPMCPNQCFSTLQKRRHLIAICPNHSTALA